MLITLQNLFFVVTLILIIAGTLFFNHVEHDLSDITRTPYECGFVPFSTDYPKNSIKFFVHAILYLVFDLEIMLLLAMVLSHMLLPLTVGIILLILVIAMIFATYLEINENMFA